MLLTGGELTIPRKALGRWPNAPLALVVAQVRFVPYDQTKPYLVAERIQHATGSEYPHLTPLQTISVVIGKGQPVVIPPQKEMTDFELRNSENNKVIKMQRDGLTFMTSAYQDSTHFLNQWRVFMAALCENRELRVLRLGVRYVDFIIPSEGHVPEDYFRDGLGRSPGILGEQSPVSFTLYDFPRQNGGQLRLQYRRGFGPPSLPPDLQDSVLPPGGLTTRSSGDISAVLDMDRWRIVNDSMSTDDIISGLEELRSDMATAFQSIMTELAEREWKNPPSEEV